MEKPDLDGMRTDDESQPLDNPPTVRDREGPNTPGAPPGRGKKLEEALGEEGMPNAAAKLEGMLNIKVNPDKTPRDENVEEAAVDEVLKEVAVGIAPDEGDVPAGREEEDEQMAEISENKPKYEILKSLIDYIIGLNIFYRGARHLSMAWSTLNALWIMTPRYLDWFSAAKKVGSLDAAIAADPVGGAVVSSYVTSLYTACMNLGWGGQVALGLIIAGLGVTAVQVYYRIRRGRDSMSEDDKQAMEEERKEADDAAFSVQVGEIVAAGKQVRKEDEEVIHNIIMPYRRWVRAIQLQQWGSAGHETKLIINGVKNVADKGWTFEAVNEVLDIIPRAGSTVRRSVPAIKAYMKALKNYKQDRDNKQLNKKVAEAYTDLQISLYNTAILISPINSTISTGLAGLPVAAAAGQASLVVSGAARGAQYLANHADMGVKLSAGGVSEMVETHDMYHQAASEERKAKAAKKTIETGKKVAEFASELIKRGGGGSKRRRKNNKPSKRRKTLRKKSKRKNLSKRRKTTVRRKSKRLSRKSKRLSRK